MYRILLGLCELFFPARCIGCGKPGSGLCGNCSAALPLAQPLPQKERFAVYDYHNRITQKAIRQMKYYRKGEAALALCYAAAPHIEEFLGDMLQSLSGERIALVPIPQYKKRTRVRGFNPSVFVARALTETIKDARIDHVLMKIRNTPAQARLKSKIARLENLKGSMQSQEALSPRTLYIIVDDVTTTGATFTEATRALREAGAKKIFTVALAHGYARK